MRVTQSFMLPHPWEKVAEVLCDPEFNVDREKLRDGVISSEFELVEQGEREMRFDLRTKEYKRKKTGGIDRSGTFESVTHCRWDPKARQLGWDYHGDGGDMVVLSGVYRLEPVSEEKTRFAHDVTIEVKIPLLGKQIAKQIARQFQREDDRYPKLWERYLSQR